MNGFEWVRSWLRPPSPDSRALEATGNTAAVQRKIQTNLRNGLPAVLTPWQPGTLNGGTLPKPTPQNLRRFAELPCVRRAINVVKDRIACMEWQVRFKPGAEHTAEDLALLQALQRNFESPNPHESFRTFAEQVLEDVIVGGFGAAEIEVTGNPAAPFRLWPVDGATIQMDGRWNGDLDSPRFAQVVARPLIAPASGSGSGGEVPGNLRPLLDRELLYIRLNPRTHTPFGLGRVEVAFDTVNHFLQANRYAARLASNSVTQYALWIDETTPTEHERLLRWWRDEVEGSGEVPVLSSQTKPEVLRFAGGTDAELRLQWQEFLLRMVANAFDLPPMFLGLHGDVNRSTAVELSEQAFQTAVLPVASLFAEHLSRDVLGKALGLHDVEFVFTTRARDEVQEAALQMQLLQAGVLSVDEVRAMRGLPARG